MLRLTDEALAHIRSYHWPGNVRELENTLERAVILNEDEVITAESLDIGSAVRVSHSALPLSPTPCVDVPKSADMSLDDYFRHFVLSNQHLITETEMARRLGISRKSLWEKRQRLGIPKPRKQSPGVDS